jgi:hypothetical protein
LFVKYFLFLFSFIVVLFLFSVELFSLEAQQNLPTGCLEEFRAETQTAHNQHRALCGVPPLIESSTIDVSAQAWATKITTTNIFDSQLYGENLYRQFDAGPLKKYRIMFKIGEHLRKLMVFGNINV